MEFSKVVSERQSIRKYRKDPVPDEKILEILEAARAAPSWANTQVCSYVVVRDPAIREKLAEALPPGNPARGAVAEAPCLIVIVAQKGVSGFKKGAPATDKGDWYMFDSGIAMEHLVLAAWNAGLGTVHVGLFDAAKAGEALGVPEDRCVVEMTPLGAFDEAPRKTSRKPLKEIAFLDVYGRPFPGA
jgi:nitroreductase